MVLTEDSGKNRPRVPADRTPTTEREITVQSDDQHILDILESRGDTDNATRAESDLPEKVNTDKDSDLPDKDLPDKTAVNPTT